MGRELKRVPLDFSWPLNMPWKGYMNPYGSQKCKPCDGSGHNPATKQISDDFYDFGNTGRRWSNKITQDEVDALVAHGRLSTWKDGQWVDSVGLTSDVVNAAQSQGLLGNYSHDAINRGILIEARAKRLGVYGECATCGGEGEIWFNDTIKQLSENWHEEERYDPPAGDGFQVWETVSEGSPISPVFATAEETVEWLVDYEGYQRKNADRFVRGAGWTPSFISVGGKVARDIDSLGLDEEES